MSKLQGDSISNLPVNNAAQYDKDIANVLFTEKKAINSFVHEFKEALFVVLLFLIFQSSKTDELLIKVYPSGANNYIRILAIKCILIVFLFYFYKNFSFSKKSE